jgi:porphobilinogen deaminase
MHAVVLKPDGSQWVEGRVSGPRMDAVRLGESAGRDLLAQISRDFFES